MIECEIRLRLAIPTDASGIFAVLEEVAPKIPLTLEGDERKAKVRELIQECCSCGQSWVATESAGRIIGFLLAKPSGEGVRFELWGERQPAGLELLYGGVTKAFRHCGIFHNMMAGLKGCELPLYGTVKHTNQCDMAGRLVRIGFEKFGTSAEHEQGYFRWRPPTACG